MNVRRTDVFRAPMRSRDDSVDYEAAAAWAVSCGTVGVGGRLSRPPVDTEAAVTQLADVDPRAAARLRRFVEIDIGSFVWTLVAREPRLGRITGPWLYDASDEAWTHDLPHTRACAWLDHVPPTQVPAGVWETFARGGRNVQRIHGDALARATRQAWEAHLSRQ